MNGKVNFENSELKGLLEQEFLIHTDTFGEAEYTKIRKTLFAYESVYEFYKDTGWAKDNPELRSEEYLIQNRICRWWDGQFIYFSRILWEDREEAEME